MAPYQYSLGSDPERFKGQSGKSYQRFVHRLVALAFLGEPPTTPHTVDHIDTNAQNNHISNLRRATKEEQQLNHRKENEWPICHEHLPHEQRLNSVTNAFANLKRSNIPSGETKHR